MSSTTDVYVADPEWDRNYNYDRYDEPSLDKNFNRDKYDAFSRDEISGVDTGYPASLRSVISVEGIFTHSYPP